ncbi:glutathione S-transferase family protein [Neptunicoccus cionae]|uniref:glutathione S-transferase family protein n=1 Tax=Neptunicoccus cionae TaxID=2035344 RepID=UPI000C78E8D8|nr:glutathione S-transferase [Amylibacter cionae]PLS22423.1 glutathione S-transferase [Amylibacter cionae]
MITVHHLNRSRSLRILWLLEELGLEYKVIRYERDAQTNLAPPELLALHPLGKSPMVELDGRLISESAAIVETLCAKHGPHLVPPRDTDAYTKHLELMHFAEGSAMTPILLNLYTGRLGEAAAPLQPRIQSELTSHFSYMEQMLRSSGHFVLDDLSAADVMLSFPATVALRMNRGADFPKLAAFVDWMNNRPAFQAALAKGGGD